MRCSNTSFQSEHAVSRNADGRFNQFRSNQHADMKSHCDICPKSCITFHILQKVNFSCIIEAWPSIPRPHTSTRWSKSAWCNTWVYAGYIIAAAGPWRPYSAFISEHTWRWYRCIFFLLRTKSKHWVSIVFTKLTLYMLILQALSRYRDGASS